MPVSLSLLPKLIDKQVLNTLYDKQNIWNELTHKLINDQQLIISTFSIMKDEFIKRLFSIYE